MEQIHRTLVIQFLIDVAWVKFRVEWKQTLERRFAVSEVYLRE